MLAQECITPRVFMRLVEWLREDPIRPASTAFTAGIERQIAYALEMDVLPEVKRLRIQLQNAMVGKCKRCGGPMEPSKAIAQTYTGMPDFPGDKHCVTLSPGGPGVLVDCRKCSACGWSVTA